MNETLTVVCALCGAERPMEAMALELAAWSGSAAALTP